MAKKECARRLRIGSWLVGTMALFVIVMPAPVLAQTLPAGWSFSDVGAPVLRGSATFQDGTFSVAGAGAGVSGQTDQLALAHRAWTGDGTIVARVVDIPGAAASLGIMIRESLAGDSRHVFLGLRAGRLTVLYRSAINALVGTAADRPGIAPVWLRLQRQASSVVASVSTNGVDWAVFSTFNFTFAPTVYGGLVVASGYPGTLETDRFSGVSITAAGLVGGAAPTVSLTSPTGGSTFVAPATLPFAATASDADGISDVRFYANGTLVSTDATAPYASNSTNVAAGTYTLTAVARDNTGLTTTSAAVNVTVAAGTGAPTVSLTSPSSGSNFVAPAALALTATASDPDGIADVHFYAGATLLRTDTTAPYSYNWMSVPAGVYALTAVARDNTGRVTTSAPVNVTVSGSGGNVPPAVSLTTPTSGAQFPAPASVALAATALDTDGTIAGVQFYSQGVLVGTDMASPYSTTLSGLAAGQYTVTAVAQDNTGARTTSSAVTFSVTSGQVAPTVSLTSPAAGSSFTAATTIAVTATASDSDGTVARVEFYAGSTLLGTDTTSPYAISWSNPAAGQHSLTAVARDNGGATAVSAAHVVTVTVAGLPGTAVFSPSADHDTMVERYVVDFYPASADPNASNPIASRDVGKPAVINGECSADVSPTVSALPVGNYYAIVRAFNGTYSSPSAPSPLFTR